MSPSHSLSLTPSLYPLLSHSCLLTRVPTRDRTSLFKHVNNHSTVKPRYTEIDLKKELKNDIHKTSYKFSLKMSFLNKTESNVI